MNNRRGDDLRLEKRIYAERLGDGIHKRWCRLLLFRDQGAASLEDSMLLRMNASARAWRSILGARVGQRLCNLSLSEETDTERLGKMLQQEHSDQPGEKERGVL